MRHFSSLDEARAIVEDCHGILPVTWFCFSTSYIMTQPKVCLHIMKFKDCVSVKEDILKEKRLLIFLGATNANVWYFVDSLKMLLYGICYVFQSAHKQWYILFEKKSLYILSDSEKKSRTKSNTKEFQSTRDPREFKVSLLLYQHTVCFNTLINSCFMCYGHNLGKLIKILYFVWVGNVLHDHIHDNTCFCFSRMSNIYFICFILYKIKFDFVLITAWFSSSCEALFGWKENIWCQNMFDRICLCCLVVFIHMKCQHGFY